MGLLIFLATTVVLLTLIGTVAVIYKLQHPVRKTYAYALAKGLPTEPSELGLSYTDRRFEFSDGTVTSGWVIDGLLVDGPICVVTHGWSSSRYASLLKVPLLASFTSRVVVYDMRGHGESSAGVCGVGTSEVVDLVQIINQLEDRETPVVLFGISMGAGVSIAAAAEGEGVSQRVVSVIAEGPYRRFLEPIVGHLKCLKIPDFPVAQLATGYMAWRLGGLQGFDRVALAKKIACPLLVLHGSEDPICRLDSAREIAEVAVRGRLVVFEGGGHSDLAMVDHQLYVRSLRECLESARFFQSSIGSIDRSISQV